MSKHNKYYWEVGRNGYVTDTSHDKRIPSYYVGKNHKYEARKVVEDFEGPLLWRTLVSTPLAPHQLSTNNIDVSLRTT